MWYLSILLLLQQPDAQAAAQPETPASAPAPNYAEGPMRIELVGLGENRVRYVEPPPGTPPIRAQIRMQFRLAGERLDEIVRVGQLVFEELADDTGTSMIAPNSNTEDDRARTRVVQEPAATRQQNGLLLPVAAEGASRAARTIQTMKGSVRVVYGSTSEEITIENPLQFRGKNIEHPRLQELGVEVHILPLNDPPIVDSDRRMAVQFGTGDERIRGVELFDAWMKALITRQSTPQASNGKPCVVYEIMGAMLTEDTQLVVNVFPQVEDMRVLLHMQDVELP